MLANPFAPEGVVAVRTHMGCDGAPSDRLELFKRLGLSTRRSSCIEGADDCYVSGDILISRLLQCLVFDVDWIYHVLTGRYEMIESETTGFPKLTEVEIEHRQEILRTIADIVEAAAEIKVETSNDSETNYNAAGKWVMFSWN